MHLLEHMLNSPCQLNFSKFNPHDLHFKIKFEALLESRSFATLKVKMKAIISRVCFKRYKSLNSMYLSVITTMIGKQCALNLDFQKCFSTSAELQEVQPVYVWLKLRLLALLGGRSKSLFEGSQESLVPLLSQFVHIHVHVG